MSRKYRFENQKPHRPVPFKPEYTEMLKEHLAEQWSFNSFGGKIGVSAFTLRKYRKQNPEFDKVASTYKQKNIVLGNI